MTDDDAAGAEDEPNNREPTAAVGDGDEDDAADGLHRMIRGHL